jgi:hypothetical protein
MYNYTVAILINVTAGGNYCYKLPYRLYKVVNYVSQRKKYVTVVC